MSNIQTRIGIDDRASPKLRRAAQETQRYGRQWGRTARMTTRAMRRIDRGFARLGRSMRTLMRRAKFMMIGLQLTALIMGTQMVRAALKYERALRNVTSLMAGAGMDQMKIEKTFRRMDGAIRRMAVKLGQSPEDLAAGMYNVVSATFEGASALKVLEAAATGALAGLSDTNTVTGLLTKTLQAYRRENETNAQVAARSTDVMDTYFMAVNRGMFTFDDLASKMGALPSTAAAFGVNLQDLSAFLSTATIRGMGLDEAIVGVRQAMLQIGKMTPQTEKAAESIFGSDWKEMWSATALAENGLFGMMKRMTESLPHVSSAVLLTAQTIEDEGGDAMKYLASTVGENIVAIAELFPNIRALKAVLSLSGPGMALYAENMDYMGQRAGATARALEEMEKSGSLALQKFGAVLKVVSLDAGGLVLPLLTNVGNSVVDWYTGISQRFADEGGLFDDDMWMDGVPDSQAEAEMVRQANSFWDAATPGDRLSYTLRSAWATALGNLVSWFDSGGQAYMSRLGEKFGDAIQGALEFMMGVEGVGDSVFVQMGIAFRDGVVKAFEDFSWSEFFESTIGVALASILGFMIGGPGGAIGAGIGAADGQNPIVTGVAGAAAWKIFSAATGAGAAGAGAGAAGAGAAGAGAAGAAGGAGLVLTVAALTIAAGAVYLVGKEIFEGFEGLGDQKVAAGAGLYLNEILAQRSSDPMQRERSGETLAGFYEDKDEATSGWNLFDNYAYTSIYRQMEGLRDKYGEGSEAGIAEALSRLPDDIRANFEAAFALGMTGVVSGGMVYGATPSEDYMNDPSSTWQIGGQAWSMSAGTMTRDQLSAAEDMMSGAAEQAFAAAKFHTAVTQFGGVVRAYGHDYGYAGGGTPPPLIRGGGQQALGGSGTVYKPTLFMAGEAGAEDYSFTPRRKLQGSGSGRAAGTVVHATISVTEAGNPRQTAAHIVRELEKAMLNG